MSKDKVNILLAEDDLNFGEVLKNYLELSDHAITWCKNGIEAYKTFNSRSDWDICLLDVMMPEMDGFTLAGEIRKLNRDIPLFFLTAKALKEDVLTGYKCGADDYIIKPFDAEVLLYKISAIISRHQGTRKQNDTNKFKIGKLTFDYTTRQLCLNESCVQLSPKEAELLKYLCLYQNDVLPRELALKNIWNNDDYFSGRSMDVYLAKLRKHLKQDPALEIISIHGKGFRLTDNTLQV
ncbi:MAG: response regulator transcription factor [Bacteroidota bacterium]|nr:response regulator transcription factor [Bacteroidota bacterium]